MKRIILSINLFLIGILGYSQTGPAGVGTSTNNVVWLNADKLSLSDNDAVSSWTDFSGNANHAAQGSGTLQPIFKTNQVNGFPAIEFDGSDDYLDFTSNLTTQATSVFFVFSENNPQNWHGVLSMENHLFLARRFNTYNVEHASGSVLGQIINKTSGYSVFSARTSSDASGLLVLTSGTLINNFTRTGFYSGSPRSAVGLRSNGNAYEMDGQLAELIVYNEKLDSASTNIILSSLAAKYNLTSPSTLYAFKTTYNHDVIGIGQESDGSNTTAQGNDSLIISNPTTMGNGDYLLVGNNAAGFTTTSTSFPGGIAERWDQVWRIDKTGTPGNIDLEFFVGAGFADAPADYVLLIENVDGDFSNGGTQTIGSGTFNGTTNSIKFTGVNLSDGAYFTLAEQSSDVTAHASGSWKDKSTWTCNCVPSPSDIVSIPSPFNVTIDSSSSALDLTIASGASLSFNTSDTLKVFGNLSISGGFTAGTGTVSALSTEAAKTFTNSSGANIAFNDLFVNNTSGLNLGSGGWSITNSLQVSSGGIDVTGADSVVIVSNASKTAEIKESMSGAFTGNFIIQRYIGSRNANFANLSSPINGATAADLDDDLFLSGLTGSPDGNATVSGGGIFYSMHAYYPRLSQNGQIDNVTAPLHPGVGYEVYLATTSSTFNATTIDFRGVPTSGALSTTVIVDQGWNLLGNPYQSHINYDSIQKSIYTADNYYVYNTDNGSYDFFDGDSKPLIAPGQGFWTFKIPVGGNAFRFAEDDKESSTSSSFLRKRNDNRLTFNISSSINPFKHKLRIDFNADAVSGLDEFDAHYLKSPLQEAPAILSKAKNSGEELILNTVNGFEESHVIPISIYTGVEGKYTLDAINIENTYDNYSCIYLKDKLNDNTVDLSIESSYSFDTKSGKSDRFDLILSNSFVECEKLINDESTIQTIKQDLSLRNSNGEWLLDYSLGDTEQTLSVSIYNMNGQLVSDKVEFSTSGAGYYRLNNLANLHGIFLIQVKGNNLFLNKTIKL